jgi:hypothetical protein
MVKATGTGRVDGPQRRSLSAPPQWIDIGLGLTLGILAGISIALQSQ